MTTIECPNWADAQCCLPVGHDGPCYNQEDDIIWREPTPAERQSIAQYDETSP